jgi:hypothetical protein
MIRSIATAFPRKHALESYRYWFDNVELIFKQLPSTSFVVSDRTLS